MKGWIGLGLVILGLLFGLFVGGYLCLYGGIVQAIHGVTHPDGFQVGAIAFGIVRIVCASFSGGIAALVFIIPGWAIVQDEF